MAETVRKKTIGEMSSDARILCNFLDTHLNQTGDYIEYHRLSTAIGRDIQTVARGILQTARKHFEREHNCILECVRGEGLKWTDQRSGLLESHRRHVNRQSRRVTSRVVNSMVDAEILNDEKNKIAILLSLIGAIDQFSRNSAVKKLESKMQSNGSGELPVQETLRLFTEKTKT